VHLPIGSSRVYVDSTVAWFDNDPIVSGQPSLQSLWVTAAGGYRASPWLSVEVYGSRVGQDTQRAGGNVRQNVLGFRVVVSKPMRVRRSVV
jgi:hypothetical protein